MEDELWKKVRTRLFPEDYQKSSEITSTSDSVEQKSIEIPKEKDIEEVETNTEILTDDEVPIYVTLGNFLNSLDFSIESLLNQESALYKILQKGIFSGFLHLILIVFSLGLISSYIFPIPAWFCGMIAGFFVHFAQLA